MKQLCFANVLQVVIGSLLILFTCSACVQPPKPSETSVIPAKEFDLVMALRKGQNYARSGRMDLAETYYRQALKLSPDVSTIYNDLGYVLLEQNRLDEAKLRLQQALELEPNNISARLNYAQVLYKSDDFESAGIQYQSLITQYQSGIFAAGSGDRLFSNAELVKVYRYLATTYYRLGVLDEAICYSALAYTIGANMYEAELHSRMLLALDKSNTAREILRIVIVANQGRVPPSIWLNYAISLYATNALSVSADAATRVLSSSEAELNDRFGARVLLGAIAVEKDDETEVDVLAGLLREDIGDDICLESTQTWWPIKFQEGGQRFMSSICADG